MIYYHVSPLHQMEPDLRLADAMLYAALQSCLGDRISVYGSMHEYSGEAPLWGPDHDESPKTLRRRAAAFRDPAVLAALQGVIVPAHGAGEAMDALASNGMRPAIRSMADPIERCFYPGREGPFSGPDGVFERQKDRLRLSSDDDEVCIHPAHDLIAERRYLIVAGQIAAETPLTYCNEDPARLLDPENQRREPAGGFMSPLVPADPRHLELQRAEVERLLQAYPMTSGAIDVGILTEGGSKRAQIEQVWAAPPGGAHTLFADPIAYAEMVAEHLHELEPTLFAEEDLSL